MEPVQPRGSLASQVVLNKERADWDRIGSEFLKEIGRTTNGYLDSLPPLQQKRLLYALSALGDVRGKRVLVCGCGKGVEAIQLQMRGARVVTFDLSHSMCRLTQLRVRMAGARAEIVPVQSAFEGMPFRAGEFDCAFGVDILHHLGDLRAASQELRRVLHPGGHAVFIETWAGNPLLLLGRKYVAGRWGIPLWGSRSEAPLNAKRLEEFGECWARRRLHFPIMFLFLKLVDNIIIGAVSRQGDSPSLTRGLLLWVWHRAQGADMWLSPRLPEWLKSRLSYTCQAEFDSCFLDGH